jgi:anti-sigma factor ChrR (cupin superfamily)
MKVNANFQAFASTNFDATQYIPSPAYGVNRFMLDRIGSERARATTIVQYAPNSYVLLIFHKGALDRVVSFSFIL